ncbi:MAG: hypothetical protein OSB34_16640, partial [Planktomarina sp.]|nr:hypothetical protein [Planktomarina sp.]
MAQIPLAITCGDPSGIGLEIFLAAHSQIGNEIPMVLFADKKHLPNGVDVTYWRPGETLDSGRNVTLYQIDFA